MRQMHLYTVDTINSAGSVQVQTVSSGENYPVKFNNYLETLVVVMTTSLMSEGYINGGGQVHGNVISTDAETYVGGSCKSDYVPVSDFINENHFPASYAANQWYVSLNGVFHAVAPTVQPSNFRPLKLFTSMPTIFTVSRTIMESLYTVTYVSSTADSSQVPSSTSILHLKLHPFRPCSSHVRMLMPQLQFGQLEEM